MSPSGLGDLIPQLSVGGPLGPALAKRPTLPNDRPPLGQPTVTERRWAAKAQLRAPGRGSAPTKRIRALQEAATEILLGLIMPNLSLDQSGFFLFYSCWY